MIPIDAIFILFMYSIGLIVGLIPPYLWGKNGGDEGLITNQPDIKEFLKLIHHYQIGIAMLIVAFIGYLFIFQSTIWVFISAWGTSTAMDDILFHSFEQYFKRKIKL